MSRLRLAPEDVQRFLQADEAIGRLREDGLTMLGAAENSDEKTSPAFVRAALVFIVAHWEATWNLLWLAAGKPGGDETRLGGRNAWINRMKATVRHLGIPPNEVTEDACYVLSQMRNNILHPERKPVRWKFSLGLPDLVEDLRKEHYKTLISYLWLMKPSMSAAKECIFPGISAIESRTPGNGPSHPSG